VTIAEHAQPSDDLIHATSVVQDRLGDLVGVFQHALVPYPRHNGV